MSALNVPSNTFHDNVQGLVKRLDEGKSLHHSCSSTETDETTCST